MKKKYPCEVDCANCARKLEEVLKSIDGVEEISVNYMTQRMTLTAAEDRFEDVLHAVLRLARQVDPDAVIQA